MAGHSHIRVAGQIGVAGRTEVLGHSLGVVVGIEEVVVHTKVSRSPEVDQAVSNPEVDQVGQVDQADQAVNSPEGDILVVTVPTVAVVAVVQYLLVFLEEAWPAVVVAAIEASSC